jgi:hypothetical protein
MNNYNDIEISLAHNNSLKPLTKYLMRKSLGIETHLTISEFNEIKDNNEYDKEMIN